MGLAAIKGKTSRILFEENLLGDLSIRWGFAKGCYVYLVYRNARKTSAFRPGMKSANTAGVPLVSNILIPAFAAAQCTGE